MRVMTLKIFSLYKNLIYYRTIIFNSRLLIEVNYSIYIFVYILYIDISYVIMLNNK